MPVRTPLLPSATCLGDARFGCACFGHVDARGSMRTLRIDWAWEV